MNERRIYMRGTWIRDNLSCYQKVFDLSGDNSKILEDKMEVYSSWLFV